MSHMKDLFFMVASKENESIEQYITRLRTLTLYCEYQAQLDEQLRDQIIAICTFSKLRKRLLVEPDLDLAKVRTFSKIP